MNFKKNRLFLRPFVHLQARFNQTAFFLISPVVLVFFSSCKERKIDFQTTRGYVVGPSNDIQVFNGDDPRLNIYDFRSSAVLITTTLRDNRVKFCSGTLVAPAPSDPNLRVLTNHHCFAESDDQGKSTAKIIEEACTRTRIHLDYIRGKTASSAMIKCRPGSLRSEFDMDLAIFTLDAPLGSNYRPLPIFQGTVADLKGKPALLIHFPDLVGGKGSAPKMFGELPTLAYTENDCTIQGPFRDEDLELDRTLPYGIRHSCDLIHGSSGSALLDPQTGTIFGVNWGGIQINQGGEVRIDNVATSAPFVRAFLEGRTSERLLAEGKSGAQGALTPKSASSADLEQKSEASMEAQPNKKKGACGVVLAGDTRQDFHEGSIEVHKDIAKKPWSFLAVTMLAILSLFLPYTRDKHTSK